MINSVTQTSYTAPPHRPGTGTVPDTSHLAPLLAALPLRVDQTNWHNVTLYAEGFRLAIDHYSWEAHEAWEAVWHRTAPQSLPNELLRGLIQIANAELKLTLGQPNATFRLIEMAGQHLRNAAPKFPSETVLGTSPKDLSAALGIWRAAVEHLQNTNAAQDETQGELQSKSAPTQAEFRHQLHSIPLSLPRFTWPKIKFNNMHHNSC